MSLRAGMPKARVPDSHCFLAFSRGERMRTIAFRPGVLYGLMGLVPLLCAWYLGATVYLIFRDDMLGSLMRRQAEMQYAYEDRLAAMRGQLDRVTSRQLLDQDSFDGKVHELLSRQAQLETRGAIVASLTDQAGFGRDPLSWLNRPVAEAKHRPLPVARPVQAGLAPATPGLPALAPNVSSFAPAQSAVPPAAFDSLIAKPRIEDSVKNGDVDPPAIRPLTRNEDGQDLPDSFLPVGSKLNRISSSLDRIEIQQVASLSAIEGKARALAQKLRGAIADAGLREDRLTAPARGAQGGPFVPLSVDPGASPFERELNRLQVSLVQADRYRRLMPYMPLRKPLPGALDVTSGFGARVDPFLGRAAMHTGVDFRDDYGTGIRVTAAGKVIAAGRTGGYGNMVEVDHGNGLTTRYGHLSQILVSEGQSVDADAVIGKLGSTGRSTGPHLHYETRIDGEPVNPLRFLKAGERLFGG